MNHDILITTTGSRPAMLARAMDALVVAMEKAVGPFRVTMIVDGTTLPSEIILAHRIVQHTHKQGIAFAVNEWMSYLRLTRNYYHGTSTRTVKTNAFEPRLCTLLQDDAIIESTVLSFIEEHHVQLFRVSPWLSGYKPKEHKLLKKVQIGGQPIEHRAMGCAVHLTARFSHWSELVPIPKHFEKARINKAGDAYAADVERGNPSRSPRIGSRIEHWLFGDCPRIESFPGVAVIPGGVQHIGGRESVWNQTTGDES